MQGGVYKIKPLGVYAMIDDGELDWKVGQRAYLHDHLFVRTRMGMELSGWTCGVSSIQLIAIAVDLPKCITESV
jgi:hypothetical protein